MWGHALLILAASQRSTSPPRGRDGARTGCGGGRCGSRPWVGEEALRTRWPFGASLGGGSRSPRPTCRRCDSRRSAVRHWSRSPWRWWARCWRRPWSRLPAGRDRDSDGRWWPSSPPARSPTPAPLCRSGPRHPRRRPWPLCRATCRGSGWISTRSGKPCWTTTLRRPSSWRSASPTASFPAPPSSSGRRTPPTSTRSRTPRQGPVSLRPRRPSGYPSSSARYCASRSRTSAMWASCGIR